MILALFSCPPVPLGPCPGSWCAATTPDAGSLTLLPPPPPAHRSSLDVHAEAGSPSPATSGAGFIIPLAIDVTPTTSLQLGVAVALVQDVMDGTTPFSHTTPSLKLLSLDAAATQPICGNGICEVGAVGNESMGCGGEFDLLSCSVLWGSHVLQVWPAGRQLCSPRLTRAPHPLHAPTAVG